MSHLNIYMYQALYGRILLAILLSRFGSYYEYLNCHIFSQYIVRQQLRYRHNVLSGGIMSIYIVRIPSRENDVVLAGIGQVLSICSYNRYGFNRTGTIKSTLQPALWGFGGGVYRQFSFIGTLPIWENLFKVTNTA